MTDWSAYVASYHEERPGISEQLLAPAVDADGRSPYDWLWEAIPDGGEVVDVACGSGPVLRRLAADARVAVGIDRSAAELACARRHCPGAAVVRADAASLPLRHRSAGTVTVSLALMILSPLAEVLAEIARVLRPGGVLVATLPVRSEPHAVADDAFGQVLSDLGQRSTPYPNALRQEDLSRAGLALGEDLRRSFVRPVRDEADAELVVRSFYTPGTTAEQVRAAVARLCRRVADGPVEVTFTIRRIVAAARPGSGGA